MIKKIGIGRGRKSLCIHYVEAPYELGSFFDALMMTLWVGFCGSPGLNYVE